MKERPPMNAPLAACFVALALLWSGCSTVAYRLDADLSPPPMAYARLPAQPEPGAAPASLPATNAGAPARERSPNRAADVIDAFQIELELTEGFALQARQIEFSDRRFTLPSQTWIETSFIPYFLRFAARQGLAASGEGMDCDNLARLFREFLALSNHRAGGTRDGDVPCALAKVRQDRSFGGVSGDGSYHSVAILRTELGWLAVEPQTGATTPLADYPNLAGIDWLLF